MPRREARELLNDMDTQAASSAVMLSVLLLLFSTCQGSTRQAPVLRVVPVRPAAAFAFQNALGPQRHPKP